MNEAALVKRVSEALIEDLPGCVIFKHFDNVTSGIPDLSVTWGKRTVWLEMKFGDPTYKVTPIQDETIKRLAKNGIALYAVFMRLKGTQTPYTTQILNSNRSIVVSTLKWAPHFVANYIRETIQFLNSAELRAALDKRNNF